MRAMAELARLYGKGPLSLTDIAEVEGLSLAYLEQLIAVMRRSGLVVATRGVHGGYELAREPRTISVGEVIRALEGSIAPVECASEGASEACCERESDCATKDVWVKMRESIAQVLDSTSLEDLCRSSASKASSQGSEQGIDNNVTTGGIV